MSTDEPMRMVDAAREALANARPPLPEPRIVPPARDEVEAARARVALVTRGHWDAIVPKRFRTAHLDDFGGPTRETLGEWAANPAGRNLIVVGPVGTGKTHAAVGACRPTFFEAGSTLAFWPVVDALDVMRPDGDRAAADAMRSVDLLLLDDLGAEKGSEWTEERLFALVNWRWADERPIVATSNVPLDRLRESLPPRTWSRLVGSDAVVVNIGGADRRARRT